MMSSLPLSRHHLLHSLPSTRPIDTYPVRPSSVGGWLLRGVVETVCANAADNSIWGAAQCSSIGRRAYGYPRFRSTRYE
jgi:hypothetical protein